MNNSLKVGLFGMYGLYNYGCEAIVRGSYGLIKQTWPDCEIILYTVFPKEDEKIIKDLNIIVKSIPTTKGKTVKRIFNKVLRTISIDKQFLIWDAKRIADDCDIVFSVGGDIYTIPKHILDNNMALKHSAIVEFGKKLIKYTPLVIWGASIGPFGVNNDVKEYYLNHLKDINKIFCREENTFNYLRNNGISSNLELCSDPAFYVKDIEDYRKFLKGDRLRIALNLSPLSIREQIGEHTTSFQEKVVETIKELITIPNCEIVFVPHVISPLSEKDNDLAYLKNIYEMLPDDYKQNVSILEDAEGFMGTKAFLRTCDIVIAARMHCAVNAVCEGIPTIFLCYSQKGFGMAKYIYGHTDWAIQLTEIDKELSSKLLDILSKRHAISDEIKTRISDIRCDESRIIDLFKKLV